MKLWPHQQRAIDQTHAAIRDGIRRICITSPTGSGKGVILERLIESAETAVLYTDRRALLDQTADRLRAAGFDFGLRASGHDVKVLAPIQLCMTQTEDSRVLRAEEREHFKAELVILDEAHRRGAVLDEFVGRHLEDGATVVGLTATPCGLREHYDHLIIAAGVRECIDIGALVPAHTYAPCEIDMKGVRQQSNGDYESAEMRRRYCRPVVFGNVLKHYRELNPDRVPSLLFGPDVSGARWFCEQFNAAGIPWGHVDGEQVIIGEEVLPASTETRDQLRDALRDGEVCGVSNRFVLREGVDWPFVECGILATSFGSLASCLQSIGRLLRACPSTGKKRALLIDHGGNYHRHGSPNQDREWSLDLDDKGMVAKRLERMRNQANGDAPEGEREPEPIVCPACAKVRKTGSTCLACGHTSKGKVRHVIQHDGSLREIRGDIYRPRKVSTKPEDQKAWESIYWRMRNAKTPKTFSQAIGFFRREHHADPDPSWRYMPKSPSDRARRIKDVPVADLHGEQREAVA